MITVETGTEVAGADSYVDVAFVNAYATDRGFTGWAKLAISAKEIAIRVAQEYMFVEYSSRWKGDRITETQALDWPRSGVSDRAGVTIASDSIPSDIQNAQAEYALIEALSGGLFFTPPVSATGRPIEEIEQTADVVSQRIKYDTGSTVATKRQFPKADGMVRFYLTGGGAGGRAIRL